MTPAQGNNPLSAAPKHYVGDWENGKIYTMSSDYYDDAGVLIHKYGPHIFHTASAPHSQRSPSKRQRSTSRVPEVV